MANNEDDPLALGQRIVAVLETGLRTATYKLATLMALIDFCVEHVPVDPTAELSVPIGDLADRVMELYWRQVRPLEGFDTLRQSSQPTARILRAAGDLRGSAQVAGIASLEVARLRMPVDYERARTEVTLTLAQQPLHRLQRVTGRAPGPTFLYDDSWLHDHVSRRTIAAHGGAITLFAGVAHGLARLSGLLKPTLEILWVEDVVRFNPAVREHAPDLAGHLFGRDRLALDRVRTAFFDEFGARCFYCGTRLRSGSPVDHVLPWSRVGLDGLANLVVACQACNADKSNALPAIYLVDRAIASRDAAVLHRLGADIGWPVQIDRVARAARGLYLSSALDTPTWAGRGSFVPLDLHSPPTWLAIEYEPPYGRARLDG